MQRSPWIGTVVYCHLAVDGVVVVRNQENFMSFKTVLEKKSEMKVSGLHPENNKEFLKVKAGAAEIASVQI